MGMYRHILAAIELDDNGPPVLQRAQALAKLFGSELSVVHVVEYVPIESGDALVAAPVNLMQELTGQAEQKLLALCQGNGVAQTSARILCGPVAGEILNFVREKGVDLVVVGHHPRRGLLALFSHTEEDVVARAHCDLLTLNLPKI